MARLFGTDGVRGKANTYPITAEVALKLGKAAALVLRNKDVNKKVKEKKPVFLIGKDTRLSGYMLEYALTSGLTSMGADVLLVGPMPTPAIAHLTRSFAADAGIMISASHNPSDDNGIKFFDSEGYKLPDEVESQIEDLVLKDLTNNHIKTEHITSKEIGRAYRIDDAQGRYIEFAKGTIKNNSLNGLKIVLDCANGAAYKVAPLILRELKADVIVLSNQPDGNNINKDCGALYPELAKSAVLGYNADIGITLDGDADRVILIDEEGNILDGDYILAIAGLYLLEKNKLAKNTIVATQYTNLAFDELMKKHNANVVKVLNGDRYVIDEMRKNNYNLGGEYSGHIIFSDYNTTGDGIIAALQILRIMKEKKIKLSKLASVLKKYPQITINVKVKEKKPLEKLNAYSIIMDSEKILENQGRILVRYSGTEQLIRVMVEAKDSGIMKKIANKIANAIKKEIGV
ncbi:MAG: phosphoglucosamine mutase [Candidatus Woesearchaeota archaeon]